MTDWQLEVNLRPALKVWEETSDPQEAGKAIADLLSKPHICLGPPNVGTANKDTPYGEMTRQRAKRLAKDPEVLAMLKKFAQRARVIRKEESLQRLLNNLADWGDFHHYWVNTF